MIKNNISVSDVKPGVKKDTLVATIKSHTNNVPTLLIEHTKKHRLKYMNINVIALFPEILQSSFKGLTGKAFKKNIAKLNLIDLKEFSNNDYGSVDDSPYGGGEGMVLGIEPLETSLKTIKKPGHVICLTPQGKCF